MWLYMFHLFPLFDYTFRHIKFCISVSSHIQYSEIRQNLSNSVGWLCITVPMPVLTLFAGFSYLSNAIGYTFTPQAHCCQSVIETNSWWHCSFMGTGISGCSRVANLADPFLTDYILSQQFVKSSMPIFWLLLTLLHLLLFTV